MLRMPCRCSHCPATTRKHHLHAYNIAFEELRIHVCSLHDFRSLAIAWIALSLGSDEEAKQQVFTGQSGVLIVEALCDSRSNKIKSL